MLEDLKAEICKANKDLVANGLVILTWGNVSGFDPRKGLVAIKPSGVAYDKLTPEDIVIVDLDGKTVEGTLNPSSDTATHVHLYRQFNASGETSGSGIGGITHTHSRHATMFAQARVEIACMGTTHADHFNGPIPVTRPLTKAEVQEAYEHNTGVVIVDRFTNLNPVEIPAVLVAGHAPFTWGKDAAESVKNAISLEAVARMNIGTATIRPDTPQLEDYVLGKHHQRKHGPDATYGQR
jgi:L-ribulose-5-phosphate 4-epimerase